MKQKKHFFELEGVEQLLVWKSKVAQLQRQNLPAEHLKLIDKVAKELNLFSSFDELSLENESFRESAISLAEITPKEDFILMFVMLEDYEYNGKFIGEEICSYCIQDLRTYRPTLQSNDLSFRADKPVCNCKWSCAFWETVLGTDSTDECEVKAGRKGCGWFWSQDCTDHVS